MSVDSTLNDLFNASFELRRLVSEIPKSDIREHLEDTLSYISKSIELIESNKGDIERSMKSR